MTDPLAEVKLACGRFYLSVAGIAVAMEGDKCREFGIPAELLDEIPAEELAQAVIGNRPAAELPLDLVRFFRGDQWNAAMLRWAADQINAKTAEVTP